ncbi:hypothetical protein T440DRAFT_393272 [Plenodomus tracheiphilus IPT5]|uniref:F-box domain-containing protein n=1 Tax=Plenodomus tracheiphilus IPT5 TaxID=1408161 RepID=A0A6A7BC62_9PLEO|nr:hypothetical protein T440DRAFT_393272 [Plenodomus tracheiphilus IPT5]
MFGSLWWWCSGLYVNSSDAIDLFAFIHTLPNLTTLSISMLSRSLDLFESAFTAPNPPTPTFFLLPTIKSLTLTPSASFLAAHCPDLLHLTIRDNNEQCTIEPSSSLSSRLLPSTPTFPSATLPSKTLTHLSTTAAWSTPELNFLVSNFPNLTHLNMQSEQYTYRASIPCIMVILSRLKGLRVLRLNRIHKLDVGYRAVWKRVVQECRTEGERMELWRGDERRRVGAENEVVGCAMRCCGRLREVWVGGERVARRIVGGEEEGEGVKWVWERRREDVDGEGVSALWAKYRVERQGVVVAWEVGM